MKLAFCLFRYFPYSGLSRVFLSVITEMAARGHQVDAYVYEWLGEYPDGVSINLLPSAKWTNHNRDAAYYKTVRPFLAERQYDAVVGFNKMPNLDFYFAGDFCYADKISSKYSEIYRLTPRHHHFARFEKEVFGVHSDTVLLMLSEQEKQIYQQNYATHESRFVILPPVLDKNNVITENVETIRINKRKELGIVDGELFALFVGSGFRIKGLDRAIRAMADLPGNLKYKTRLMVVGHDSAQNYRRLVTRHRLADSIEFVGGRSDVPELMLAADCLFHPAYRDTTGNVLLEATASGLPVLTTDRCGYATHIKKADAGIVLESPVKQADISLAFTAMLNSTHRQHWAENGRAYGRQEQLYEMPQYTAQVIEQKIPDILKRKSNNISKFIVKKSTNFFLTYSAEYNSKELSGLFTDPDQYLAQHIKKIIKHDLTTTVAVIECNARLMVLKRYNTKGVWHFFKRSVRVTRASICWNFAHRLIQCGLKTPKPIGYRENRVSQFRGRSYYIAEFSEGITLLDYLKQTHDEQKLIVVTRLMKQFFKIMSVQGLAHGDMKASNFLIKDGNMEVLDLDSMRSYYSARLHQHKLFRDKRRFLRNWKNNQKIYDYLKHHLLNDNEIERLSEMPGHLAVQNK